MTDDYFGQDLSLVALAGQADATDAPAISDVRFVDCELRGPALLIPGEGFHMVSAAIFDLDQAEALLVLPADSPAPDQAIALDQCFLDGCRFHNVRFANTRERLEQLFGDSLFGAEMNPYNDSTDHEPA